MRELLKRKMIFVCGKGGVGKTAVSQAIAAYLSSLGNKTLWTTFEDPTRPAGELKQIAPNLWHLNGDATQAFEEYAALKIGVPLLTKLFLQNKLIRYLSKAAPGIHELVLLGKVWHDRTKYDHVIVDMPSTGYGVAMFQSSVNFSRLFKGGPIQKDALAMLETFADPKVTAHLIVSIPEETPLRESLELRSLLLDLFPKNLPQLLVNKRFPHEANLAYEAPETWASPYATDTDDFIRKRGIVEATNLKIWEELGLQYDELPYIPARLPLGQTLALELGNTA